MDNHSTNSYSSQSSSAARTQYCTQRALRAILRKAGLPHDKQAVSNLIICYENGLTFDQAARALILMHNTNSATVCPGCRRRVGHKSVCIATLGSLVTLLCGQCVRRGDADPAGAGVQIVRNARQYMAGGAQ